MHPQTINITILFEVFLFNPWTIFFFFSSHLLISILKKKKTLLTRISVLRPCSIEDGYKWSLKDEKYWGTQTWDPFHAVNASLQAQLACAVGLSALGAPLFFVCSSKCMSTLSYITWWSSSGCDANSFLRPKNCFYFH